MKASFLSDVHFLYPSLLSVTDCQILVHFKMVEGNRWQSERYKEEKQSLLTARSIHIMATCVYDFIDVSSSTVLMFLRLIYTANVADQSLSPCALLSIDTGLLE
jgi:hypothetical protein